MAVGIQWVTHIILNVIIQITLFSLLGFIVYALHAALSAKILRTKRNGGRRKSSIAFVRNEVNVIGDFLYRCLIFVLPVYFLSITILLVLLIVQDQRNLSDLMYIFEGIALLFVACTFIVLLNRFRVLVRQYIDRHEDLRKSEGTSKRVDEFREIENRILRLLAIVCVLSFPASGILIVQNAVDYENEPTFRYSEWYNIDFNPGSGVNLTLWTVLILGFGGVQYYAWVPLYLFGYKQHGRFGNDGQRASYAFSSPPLHSDFEGHTRGQRQSSARGTHVGCSEVKDRRTPPNDSKQMDESKGAAELGSEGHSSTQKISAIKKLAMPTNEGTIVTIAKQSSFIATSSSALATNISSSKTVTLGHGSGVVIEGTGDQTASSHNLPTIALNKNSEGASTPRAIPEGARTSTTSSADALLHYV